MKQIFLLLIILPLLSFGQSKKDLKARIYSMQVDSANQAELISDQQEKIYEMEQTIGSQTRILLEAQNDIASMYSQISELTKNLNKVHEDNAKLEEVVAFQREQLKKHFPLNSSFDCGKSYEIFGQNNDKIALEDLSGFDFQYKNYKNGNGFNPPVVYPIGWSYDGKFAYYEEYCDGMCGCCSAAIVVRDLASNRTIEKLPISLAKYYELNGWNDNIWRDNEFQKSFARVVKNYKIFPIGGYRYFTANAIEWRSAVGDEQFEFLVNQKGRVFEVQLLTTDLSSNDISVGEIFQGDIKVDYLDGIGSVEYAGYFLNDVNYYLTIVLMHKVRGVEGEIDYTIELVGFELPF